MLLLAGIFRHSFVGASDKRVRRHQTQFTSSLLDVSEIGFVGCRD